MKSYVAALILAVACFGLFACSSKHTVQEAPGIQLHVSPAVELSDDRISGHSLVNITYIWRTGAEFAPPAGELLAKVHFSDADGNVFWQDDHKPIPDLREWQPNQEYRYTRKLYVPLIPRITQINLLVGLYEKDSKTKYLLDGISFKSDKYSVATLTISPPRRPEDLPGARIQFTSGWYDLERDVVSKSSWRWMSEKGVCTLTSLNKDASLFVRGWVPGEIIGKPLTLTFRCRDQVIHTEPGVSGAFETEISIPESLYQNEDSLLLEITADGSYIPKEAGLGDDIRQLAVMFKVFHLS